jgi:hypothetical protein
MPVCKKPIPESPGLCGRLPLFPSSCMTRFIRQRFKIRDESCLSNRSLAAGDGSFKLTKEY